MPTMVSLPAHRHRMKTRSIHHIPYVHGNKFIQTARQSHAVEVLYDIGSQYKALVIPLAARGVVHQRAEMRFRRIGKGSSKIKFTFCEECE
eukprot:6191021-Pleurochrysis_carterae.AAC.1